MSPSLARRFEVHTTADRVDPDHTDPHAIAQTKRRTGSLAAQDRPLFVQLPPLASLRTLGPRPRSVPAALRLALAGAAARRLALRRRCSQQPDRQHALEWRHLLPLGEVLAGAVEGDEGAGRDQAGDLAVEDPVGTGLEQQPLEREAGCDVIAVAL